MRCHGSQNDKSLFLTCHLSQTSPPFRNNSTGTRNVPIDRLTEIYSSIRVTRWRTQNMRYKILCMTGVCVRACVCVYAFSRSAENSVHCRVHNGSESLVGTDRLLIPSTDPSHQLSHRGAPSVGSWRGEGCRPRGQGERKGGETHEWTLQPVHSQPAAGAYRGKLAGRTVPTDRGPVGPGTGSLHASLGALCARLCISVSVHVCRGISVRVLSVHGRVAQGGPFVGARERAGEDLFVHTCTYSGSGWGEWASLRCAAALSLLRYGAQGGQDQGKKEAASTRHDARPARGRPARYAPIFPLFLPQPLFLSLFSSATARLVFFFFLLFLAFSGRFSCSSLLFEPLCSSSPPRTILLVMLSREREYARGCDFG